MTKKISIISVNFDNYDGLISTINSIYSQSFSDFELIVIDCMSSKIDMSFIQDINSKYDNFHFLSELDDGIYFGMNKGLDIACGELIGFLNSGDILADTNVLKDLWDSYLSFGRPDAIYGNTIYSSDGCTESRNWSPGNFKRFKYLFGWMTPHLSTYIQRTVYENRFRFDTSFSIASDYDLMLRMFFIEKFEPRYFDRNVVMMESGGISNSNFRNVCISNYEVLVSWKKNFTFIPFWIFILKPFSKVFQMTTFKKSSWYFLFIFRFLRKKF